MICLHSSIIELQELAEILLACMQAACSVLGRHRLRATRNAKAPLEGAASHRKVPSVSMYATLPAPPPSSIGSCVVTQAVIHNCDLPVRYSPYISVMHWVSYPPPRIASMSLQPVLTLTMLFWRCMCTNFVRTRVKADRLAWTSTNSAPRVW
jgi:hypothetical protein